MGKAYNLHSNLIKVEAKNRESLLSALAELSNFDCDFNGENGIEYLWKDAKEKGFTSNLDYLLDKVKNIESDRECIKSFVSEWIDTDNYYHECDLGYLTDDEGNITVISLAVTCG